MLVRVGERKGSGGKVGKKGKVVVDGAWVHPICAIFSKNMEVVKLGCGKMLF